MQTGSVSGVSGVSGVSQLRDLCQELAAQERAAQVSLRDIRRRLATAKADLQQAAQQDMGLRPLGSQPRRARQRSTVRLEAVRDAVVQLGCMGDFTASDLAARLGCTRVQATRFLAHDHIVPLVKKAGRVAGAVCYEYVAPAGLTDSPVPSIPSDAAPRPKESVVLHIQTGHAKVKGKLGEDIEVAYVTQEPYHSRQAS